jgi:hypothetical protein
VNLGCERPHADGALVGASVGAGAEVAVVGADVTVDGADVTVEGADVKVAGIDVTADGTEVVVVDVAFVVPVQVAVGAGGVPAMAAPAEIATLIPNATTMHATTTKIGRRYK